MNPAISKKRTGQAPKPGNIAFHEQPMPMEEDASCGVTEKSVSLALPYGTMEVKQWYFDDIYVGSRKVHYNDYFSFEKENDTDMVSLAFNLKGEVVIRQAGNTYEVHNGQHNIIYSPRVSNTFQNKTLYTEVFEIQFRPSAFLKITMEGNDMLKRFAEKMLARKQPVVLAPDSLPINTEQYRVIHEVLHCRFTGRLKKLFLLSKSIELLVLQADACDRALQHKTPSVLKTKEDRESIFFARDHLLQNMANPPGLSELAKISGVNEYKLKKGFKEMFHSTAFGLLSDHRLAAARQRLLDGDQSIAAIAYELGYSSPQHFSQAFRKKFGVAPGQVKK